MLQPMKNKTIPNRPTQGGFTMVEVVAVTVIMVVLAAYAVPRMMSSTDVSAKVTADRVLAALYIAQTLAQRQGVATGVAIQTTLLNNDCIDIDPTRPPSPNCLIVSQIGTPVSFPTQDYDGTLNVSGTYAVRLHPRTPPFGPPSYGLNISATATPITYYPNGIPTPAPVTIVVTSLDEDKNHNPISDVQLTIKVEATGFAHFE